MSEQIAGGEAPAVETIPTPPVEAGFLSTEAGGESRDFETEAKEMGWVPEAEFRGPKDKWKPAEQFVRDGENILPIVRAENKRLKDKLDQVEKDYATRFERLDKATQESTKALKAQHDRELASLRAQREAAVKAGDVQAFHAIDKQMSDHAASTPKVAIEEQPSTAADNETALTEWQKANAWYGTDEALTEAAIGISQRILMRNPNITMKENLRQTDEEMAKRFPLRFGKAGANGHAPVDSGGDPKAPQRADTFTSKLPAEALRQAKADVAAGIYKTTEEWAKIYFEK